MLTLQSSAELDVEGRMSYVYLPDKNGQPVRVKLAPPPFRYGAHYTCESWCSCRHPRTGVNGEPIERYTVMKDS